MVAHFEGDDRPVTFQGRGIALGGIPVGLALDVPHDLNPTPETLIRLQAPISARFSPGESRSASSRIWAKGRRLVQVRQRSLEPKP